MPNINGNEASIRNMDDSLREHAKGTLDYLVSGIFVSSIYGFEIEEVQERIEDRSMVGFDLGMLGLWLPEWQFIDKQSVQAKVSPLALALRDEWGDRDLATFVRVMATHYLDNVPRAGKSSVLADMVQLGINPLEDRATRRLFRDHGLKSM